MSDTKHYGEQDRERMLRDLRDDLAALTDKVEKFERDFRNTTAGKAAREARWSLDEVLCDLDGAMEWGDD